MKSRITNVFFFFKLRDFPGSPVKTLHFKCKGECSIPGPQLGMMPPPKKFRSLIHWKHWRNERGRRLYSIGDCGEKVHVVWFCLCFENSEAHFCTDKLPSVCRIRNFTQNSPLPPCGSTARNRTEFKVDIWSWSSGWGVPSLFTSTYMLSCSVISYSLWPPWTVTHQALLSVEFSRQEYWSGLPFPSPGNLPNQGVEPMFPTSPTLADWFLTTVPPLKGFTLYLSPKLNL